ncbi:MAG: host attachment protein [Rhodospirillales bacterium]|nr:host attachment protein [Rhodospirillales bacterium]
MKAQKMWILVADGARARIFSNDGPGKGLKRAATDDFVAEIPPTREVISDRPGSKSGPGTGHGYAPRNDWHKYEKRRFAGSMAKILNEAAHRNDFDRLVLVAPPEPLGALRAKLTPTARGRVVQEIGKDLTGLSEHELPTQLGRHFIL